MTNNQLAPERISDISDYFVEMQDHYSDPADRENFEIFRDAELLMKELQERRKAAMDSEPNRNPVLAYADSYRDMAKQGVESVQIWSVITDLERNIAPLYRHAQQPVVPPMQHWEELCREHPDMSIGDAIIRAAWWNHCRAAMLQAEPVTTANKLGNSPVIPEGYVMVPKEPTEAMINAWLSEVANWRGHVAGYKAMLAAAPQEEPDEK